MLNDSIILRDNVKISAMITERICTSWGFSGEIACLKLKLRMDAFLSFTIIYREDGRLNMIYVINVVSGSGGGSF